MAAALPAVAGFGRVFGDDGGFLGGLYVLIGRIEPLMFRNILVLTKGIPDRAGVVVFIRLVLADPLFLLAMAAFLPLLIPILSQRGPRAQLLVLYIAASFAIAVVTSIQAGAINYFSESPFASVPFAVLGLMRLDCMMQSWTPTVPIACSRIGCFIYPITGTQKA
jgi:hypothetical protein